ncbi:MAG: hypothetical protein ACXAEL_08840 [Candidatus Hodarchaeales archaeon]|jgi:hypothetical protein
MALATRTKPTKRHQLAVLGKMAWVLRSYFLSHHPDCSHYDDHVLKIGPLRLCQGCFFMYGSFALFIIAWILGRIPKLRWLDSLALALLLFIPTVFHALIGLRFRIFKIFGRLMLGGTIFFSLYSIFSQILRGFIVYGLFIFLAVFGAFGNLRLQQQVTECRESCPFGEQLPVCRGLRGSVSKLVAVRGMKEAFPSLHQSLVSQFEDSMEQPQ